MRFEIFHFARRRWIALDKLFGEPRDTETQTPHPHRLAITPNHQLDTSAADIDQEMRPAFEAHRVARGNKNQARFLGARNDLNLDAGFATNPADKLRAVLGLAHRTGRHRTHPIDATEFDQLLKI